MPAGEFRFFNAAEAAPLQGAASAENCAVVWGAGTFRSQSISVRGFAAAVAEMSSTLHRSPK